MSATALTIVALPMIGASVAFLPVGGVASVVSAAGLAVGATGLGLSVLWWRRSSWGPEEVPAIRTVARADAQRRTRAALRLQGYIGIGLGLLAATAALLFFDDDDAADSTRIRLVGACVLPIALGVASLWISRATAGPRPEEDADDIDGERPVGWIRVGRTDRTALLVFVFPVTAAIIWGSWQLLPMLLLVVRQSFLLLAIVIGLLLIAAIAGIWVWVRRLLREVSIEPDAALVRIGSREVPAASLTAARVVSTAVFFGGTRSLFLVIEAPDRLSIPLLLRRSGRLAMTQQERLATLALIDASSIALPRAKEDPTGKFSRTLFPQHVDLQRARDLVARPPRSDEDLPVPAG